MSGKVACTLYLVRSEALEPKLPLQPESPTTAQDPEPAEEDEELVKTEPPGAKRSTAGEVEPEEVEVPAAAVERRVPGVSRNARGAPHLCEHGAAGNTL